MLNNKKSLPASRHGALGGKIKKEMFLGIIIFLVFGFFISAESAVGATCSSINNGYGSGVCRTSVNCPANEIYKGVMDRNNQDYTDCEGATQFCCVPFTNSNKTGSNVTTNCSSKGGICMSAGSCNGSKEYADDCVNTYGLDGCCVLNSAPASGTVSSGFDFGGTSGSVGAAISSGSTCPGKCLVGCDVNIQTEQPGPFSDCGAKCCVDKNSAPTGGATPDAPSSGGFLSGVSDWLGGDSSQTGGSQQCGGACQVACSNNQTEQPGPIIANCNGMKCCVNKGAPVQGGVAPADPFAIPNVGLPNPSGGVKQVLENVLRWLLGIVGVIALIGFVVSGIQYIVSTGNETMMDSAKRNMMYSILGVVVVLSSFVIIQAINYALEAKGLF